MPLYEYECKKGHRTEAVRSIEDRDKEIECPVCGLIGRKVISVPGQWKIGWGYLKGRVSEPAPEGSEYHPKWDD